MMRSVLDALRRAISVPTGAIGLALLLAVAGAALVLPPLLPDPAAQPDILGGALLPPAPQHPFGTDNLSRDVLARTVGGARISLTIAVLAVAMSMSLGALVGLAAGYFGGVIDAALMRLVDGALSIPRLFIVLVVLGALERVPLGVLILVLGTTGWFGTSRLVRAEVVRVRHEPYVLAAEGLGAGHARVIFRHLLPNASGPLLVATMLGVAEVILLDAGLSFLGFGVAPPAPSLGGMIQESRSLITEAPWTSLFPGATILITVLGINLFGDALRDAFDPRSA
ncbi:MAG: ABC transporter permease [Gemmatimonadota bacterium]